MEHLIEPLKNLGLSEKEARIYLALLQLGPSTPYQIAKKAELKRPTAYVITEELVSKGLIVHVPGEDKLRYIAKAPDVFIAEREDRLMAAKQILPELKSFQKNTAKKASILYFEGVEGLRQAYQYKQKELHNKNIVGFFASPEDASSEVNQVFYEWNEYKERHHTHVKSLTVDTPALQSYAKWLLPKTTKITGKFLPETLYSAKVSLESCDDQFVRIVLIEGVQSLIIESSKLAIALREVFEMVWKGLEGQYDVPKNIQM